MAFIVEQTAYPQEGVGKPDFTREISLGQIRPGFELKYSQTLLAFLVSFSSVASAFGWFKAPLAPAAMVHCVNGTTGVDLPYSTPVGYTLTMISIGIACDQDVDIWLLLRIPPVPAVQRHLCLAKLAGGTPFYVPEVVSFSSATFDPTGSVSFDFDLQVTNIGGANMEGQVGAYMILEAVGTPLLPETKTVKCKWCGATKEVPIVATDIICDACGKMFIVYPLRQPRGVTQP